jgi:hypothetical protein
LFERWAKHTGKFNMIFKRCLYHRHSNSGPPFFLIWSLPRLWYGSLSGSISLSHLSIFYNISCYNSRVLLTFVSRSSCRFTFKKNVRNSSACGVNGWKFHKTQTSKK